MGLDVYLNKLENWQSKNPNNEDVDEFANAERIEIDSAKYPEHMFKVGYFRSSYNGGGINSVMTRIEKPDLYALFDVQEDSYIFAPDWASSLTRVGAAIKELKKWAKKPESKYDVMDIDTIFSRENSITDPAEALRAFFNEISKPNEIGWKSYSNKLGSFFFDGMKCYGFIQGTRFNQPCIYVIYEQIDGNLEWYIQAYEIVQETIEYVLAQPDPQNYYFTWSG